MLGVRLYIGKAKASKPLGGFIPNLKLKLLDQVSGVKRFKHYPIRTETYREWIKRAFILFQGATPDPILGLTVRALDWIASGSLSAFIP